MTDPNPYRDLCVEAGSSPSKVKLLDGREIDLQNYNDIELYSTFDLVAIGSRTSWEPFNYSRGQQIQESGRIANRSDTSLPKPGYVGLPQGWDALVFGWRATVEAPKRLLESDELAAWAATTSCTLKYNGKAYNYTPLSELCKALRPIVEDDTSTADWLRSLVRGHIAIPLNLRQNLGYGVEVEAHDATALSALRRQLADYNTHLMVRVYLRSLVRTSF